MHDLVKDRGLICLCPEAHSLPEFSGSVPGHMREVNGSYVGLTKGLRPELFSPNRIKVAKKAFPRTAQAANGHFDAESRLISDKIARAQQAAGVSSWGRKRKLSKRAASSETFAPTQLHFTDYSGEEPVNIVKMNGLRSISKMQWFKSVLLLYQTI